MTVFQRRWATWSPETPTAWFTAMVAPKPWSTCRPKATSPPRGIGLTDEGEWAVPVIFGVDADSEAAAVAFAIDHNNLTLLGGALGFADMLQIWEEGELQAVLDDVPNAADLLVSFDDEDVAALLTGPDFEPVDPVAQSRLDEKQPVTCLDCGHEFHP